MVGLVAVVGWRYASDRLIIDVGTQAQEALDNPEVVGYFVVFDYLQVVAGPRWFPELLTIPVAATLFGMAIGALSLLARQTTSATTRILTGAAVAAIIGAGVGLAVTFYARHFLPRLLVEPVTDPSFVLTDAVIAANPSGLHNAPYRLTLSPEVVYFPLLGVLSATIVLLTLEATRCLLPAHPVLRLRHSRDQA